MVIRGDDLGDGNATGRDGVTRGRVAPGGQFQDIRLGGERLVYYLIISRQCPGMQQELATALQGHRDIRVILDRRYGKRRTGSESPSAERRRGKDRRKARIQLPG